MHINTFSYLFIHIFPSSFNSSICACKVELKLTHLFRLSWNGLAAYTGLYGQSDQPQVRILGGCVFVYAREVSCIVNLGIQLFFYVPTLAKIKVECFYDMRHTQYSCETYEQTKNQQFYQML